MRNVSQFSAAVRHGGCCEVEEEGARREVVGDLETRWIVVEDDYPPRIQVAAAARPLPSHQEGVVPIFETDPGKGAGLGRSWW